MKKKPVPPMPKEILISREFLPRSKKAYYGVSEDGLDMDPSYEQIARYVFAEEVNVKRSTTITPKKGTKND
jgi:hypothetical protein